jgi:hypothetical protein
MGGGTSRNHGTNEGMMRASSLDEAAELATPDGEQDGRRLGFQSPPAFLSFGLNIARPSRLQSFL